MFWAASAVLAAVCPAEASFRKCPELLADCFLGKLLRRCISRGAEVYFVVSLLEKPSQGPFSRGLPVPGGSQGPRFLFSMGSVVGWDSELAPDLSDSCTFEGRGT